EILARREIEILCIVLGTEEDPQDLAGQIDRLSEAGARIFRDTAAAVAYVHRHHRVTSVDFPPVALDGFQAPLGAINVGVETFFDGLSAQEVEAVQVDWRPPAGGNEKLMAILRRMQQRPGALVSESNRDDE
ncbi:MAG: hypothetical protein AAF657_17085, partial [Acidobacteriota bacterium]